MQEFQFRLVEDETYCVMAYSGDEPEVVVPDTYARKPVTILFDGLFKGHAEITSVKIPDTVSNLGEFLFDGCGNLRRIELPASLTSMWPYAFARSGIEEITLPERLSSIAPFTFKDCKQLRKVICGPGLKTIHGKAFQGCDRLTEVRYGPDVDVSPNAFGELINKTGYERKSRGKSQIAGE